METKKTNKTGLIIGVVALVAVIAVMVVLFCIYREKPVQGSKAITIEVINQAGDNTNYPVHTDAEFLRQAMEEADGLTFSGTESEYGMMVDTVNGERADYTLDGAYWAFYINGEYCMYGIDTQPVTDGDAFSIQYTPAE